MTATKTYQTIATAFSATDIAEPVVFAAASDSAEEALGELDFHQQTDGILYCIVQDSRRVVGYLKIEDTWGDDPIESEVTAADISHPISADQFLSSSTSLLDIVPLFQQHSFFFLLETNKVKQVISIPDLEKPPFMLCIFSLIIELEMLLVEIMTMGPVSTEDLLNRLPSQKLKTAQNLRLKKTGWARPQDVLRCTSFNDKIEMLTADPVLSSYLPFHDETDRKSFFQTLLKVRNHVAHGDSILDAFVPEDSRVAMVNVSAGSTEYIRPSFWLWAQDTEDIRPIVTYLAEFIRVLQVTIQSLGNVPLNI